MLAVILQHRVSCNVFILTKKMFYIIYLLYAMTIIYLIVFMYNFKLNTVIIIFKLLRISRSPIRNLLF